MPEGTIRVLGIEGLEGKLDANLNAAGPVRRMLERSAIAVRNHAVEHVAVDTGRLRQSIAWEVDSSALPLYARVGTNVDYAPDVEFGTNAHHVDYHVLEPWAQRHNFGRGGGFLVARKIAREGTRAQPFLAPALVANEPQIDRFVAIAAQEIEDQKG